MLYEWQWIYRVAGEKHYFQTTEEHFTDEESFRDVYPGALDYERYEPSKRERK